MRSRTLALSTALGIALLPAAVPSAAASGVQRVLVPGSYGGAEATAAGAAELLARVRTCERISNGLYRTDAGTPATVPVCGLRGAVFWKADMDIDCDGQSTPRCNAATDPYFLPQTTFRQSDGRPLNAEELPFVVVPGAGALWRHSASGITGGSVVAVIHGDRVRYGVVGDTGPVTTIGEASWAMAESLGIDPDPGTGGVRSGVTYILFKDSRVRPIESHDAAVGLGKSLARKFLREN
ncbi:glycoside hydrolase family 75 protein [Streptomyces sp. NPDC001985]|uniref:glycoside hydrolase family 75 protein n=1 Tax=Streptomyces sp. NPDC001985 TaxID=3154406 RepID=UPI00332FDE77